MLSGSRVAIPIAGSASVTLDATLPPDASGKSVVFRDIIPNFSVPADEVLNVEFTLPSAETRRPFAPAVLMRSAGVATTVTNAITRDASRPGRLSLTSTIDAPRGSSTILDGYYYGLDSPNGIDDPTARDFTCAGLCPHLFPAAGVDCSVHCYTCSTTVDDSGPIIKENFNLCEKKAPDGGDPIALTSNFELLAPGQGGVHLNVMLRLGRAVSPQRLELIPAEAPSGTTLEPPNFFRRYPEFVTATGDYRYRITPPIRAGEPTSVVELPVHVDDGQVTGLYVTLPRSDSVAPRQPHVIADTRLGIVPRTVTVTAVKDHLMLDVSTKGADSGAAWILLPLAKGAVVKEVFAAGPNGRTTKLRAGLDYAVGEYAGLPSITLRAVGSKAMFTLAGPGVM